MIAKYIPWTKSGKTITMKNKTINSKKEKNRRGVSKVTVCPESHPVQTPGTESSNGTVNVW